MKIFNIKKGDILKCFRTWYSDITIDGAPRINPDKILFVHDIVFDKDYSGVLLGCDENTWTYRVSFSDIAFHFKLKRNKYFKKMKL